MKKLCFILLLLWGAKVQAQTVEGYYTDNNGTESIANIPWTDYTQVIMFQTQAGVNGSGVGNGTVDSSQLIPADITTFVTAAHAASKKALWCIKYNNNWPNAFAQDTAPGMVSTFATNITNFTTSNNFDGVTLDWEAGAIASQYEALQSALRTAMPTKIIEMTGFNDSSSGSNLINTAVANSSILDHIEVMCYDLDGGEGRTLYNDPLHQSGNLGMRSCDWDVASYTTAGVPKAKIAVGMPFYGRRWSGSTHVLQTTSVTPSTFYFRDLVTDATRWQPQYTFYDSTYGSDYLSIPSLPEFDSFTGPTTIAAIVAYGKANGFGGYMTFAMEYEYVASASGNAKYPLSTALFNAVSAPNIYITQTGASSGVCTSSVQTPAFFNNAANWGSGGSQIGPGTTVLLCGVITTSLSWQGSGTSGNPITMLFTNGAKLSQPFCGQGGGTSCMTLNGNSWWVIDGGVPCGATTGGVSISEATCNGIVEANANGTILANQNGENAGIDAGGTSNGEIKNLDVRNVYVRTSTTDSHPDANNNEKPYGIDLSGASFTGSSNISIHDGKVHDCNWCITMLNGSGTPDSGLSIYNEDTYNDNHGVAIGISSHIAITGVVMHDNHFGSMVNWDDTSGANQYHHDSYHGYTNFFDASINFTLYNNLFDGNMGTTPTGYIFLEGSFSGTVFNNFILAAASQANIPNPINNCNTGSGGTNTKNLKLYNNTMMYLGTTTMGAPFGLCGTVDVRNNAISLGYATNAQLSFYQGTAAGNTWDYNAYGNNNPTSSLFSNSSSCCVFTYAQWKSNFVGYDTNSTAILATPLGLSTTTGVPQTGSAVIGAGKNLTSLGIAALNSDRLGNARPTTGTWNIGMSNYLATTSSVSLTPNPINFGTVTVGTGSTILTATVTSNGTSPATLPNPIASFGGVNPTTFANVAGTPNACVPGSLPVGNSCLLYLQATPTSVGTKTATLNVLNATTNLSVVGQAASVTLLTISPTSANLGSVPIHTPTAPQQFVVTNAGNTNLTFVSGSVTSFGGAFQSDWSLTTTTNNCLSNQVLTPGQTCTKSIIGTPSIIGSETGTITLSTTTTTATANISMAGQNPPLSLSVTPRPLALPDTVQGQTSALRAATITNTGQGTVTLSSSYFGVTGALSGDFQLVATGTTCGNNVLIPVGGSCIMNWQAVPSGTTLEQVTLTIHSTAADVSDTMQIQGLPIPTTPAPVPIIIALQIDFFPQLQISVSGLNFVVGKTAITIDAIAKPTTCFSTAICVATLPASSVLLPGFGVIGHVIGVK